MILSYTVDLQPWSYLKQHYVTLTEPQRPLQPHMVRAPRPSDEVIFMFTPEASIQSRLWHHGNWFVIDDVSNSTTQPHDRRITTDVQGEEVRMKHSPSSTSVNLLSVALKGK